MPLTPKPSFSSCYPLYLANEAVRTSGTLSVIDKFTLDEVTKVCVATPAEIRAAIEAATEARKPMRRLPSYERKKILLTVVEQVSKRRDEFASVLATEAGKPIKDARGEVARLIDTFQVAAEESVRRYGEVATQDISERAAGFWSISKRYPLGVISCVSPFNFPLNLTAHKIAPAIAAGCPFILKPASKTPLGALMLAEILAETSLPRGAFSVLPCGRDGADLFTTDERLAALSFTGSPSVGWALKAKAGKKKVLLELGGNAAVVVDAGQDVSSADSDVISKIITGAFYQSGQSCISVQRCYVHDSIYDEFRASIKEAASALRWGNPMDDETFIGPLISTEDADRVESWIAEAVDQGATVVAGGRKVDKHTVEATVLEDVPHNVKVWDEEVFGPVMCIERFTSFKEVIDSVNDSRYGLQAGVFTDNLHHAMYAFDEAEVGGLVVGNVPSVRVDSMPYGGVKEAGNCREGIRFAMDDFTELRTMLLKDVGDPRFVE